MQLARMLGSRHRGHASTRAAPAAVQLARLLGSLGTSATRLRAQPGSVTNNRPRRGRRTAAGGVPLRRLGLGALGGSARARSRRRRLACCVAASGARASGSAGRSRGAVGAAAGRRRANVAAFFPFFVGPDFVWPKSILKKGFGPNFRVVLGLPRLPFRPAKGERSESFRWPRQTQTRSQVTTSLWAVALNDSHLAGLASFHIYIYTPSIPIVVLDNGIVSKV